MEHVSMRDVFSKALFVAVIVLEATRFVPGWSLGAVARGSGSQSILANPSIETCPTSNCPKSPAVLSSFFVHGTTTKGAQQAEWLSNVGLLVRTGNPDGQKVSQYIGVMQSEGAGTAWALNTDLVRNAIPGGSNSFGGFEGSGVPGRPGAIGVKNGSIGYELDFTNWDADSSPGVGAFTVGEYVHAQSTFTSLAALYFDATMQDRNEKNAWTDGILFNGPRVVRDNTFYDGTHSSNSLVVGGQHQTGLNTAAANSDLHAVVLKENQTICFNELTNCVTWKAGQLSVTNHRGERIFRIDENGNAFFSGHVFSK